MAIDPKKAALLILSKGKGASDDDDSESLDGSPEPSEGAVSAMQDFMDALKAEDPKAACKAMSALQDLMDDDSDSDDAS